MAVQDQPNDQPSLADTTERLFAQFDGHIPLPQIIDAVRQARADLDGHPPAALPELVERLAHQRLLEASTDNSDQRNDTA